MISGRIMLDGKRKIAIWNILDWRNPDLVMEKSLALLSSGIQGRMLLRNRRELIHLGQVRTAVLPRDECACFPVSSPSWSAIACTMPRSHVSSTPVRVSDTAECP